ncbi:ubiquitin-protein ligase E3A-like [Watersipora subatra]|uniref:ubiquitin-protein ligase E3A-like n=1 Tax=Watersipora subatra TaxID=2589382 RepID=UPI00355C3597
MEVDEQGEASDSALSPLETKLQKSPKELIEQYFKLLTQGCGNAVCSNKYCASSAHFYKRTSVSPNEAAIEAIRLVKQKIAVECTVARETMVTQPTPSTSSSTDAFTQQSSSVSCKATPPSTVTPLSHTLILDTIKECKKHENWSELVRLIGRSFSQIDVLLQSFRKEDDSNSTLDMTSLQAAYTDLFSLSDNIFTSALCNAITTLSTGLAIELQYRIAYERDPKIVNIILIILSLPVIGSPEFIEQAYPEFLKAVTYLPLQGQKTLVQTFVRMGKEYQRSLLFSLQTLITVKIVSHDEWGSRHLNNDDSITSAAKMMKLVYYASLLGGEMDTPEMQFREKEHYTILKKSVQEFIQSATESTGKDRAESKEDPLALALGVKPLDSRNALIPRHEFINSAVNDTLEMDVDFTYFRSEGKRFSFISHPFLLNTATKNLALYYDSRVRMLSERRSAILSSLISGGQHVPNLRLRVRRDHLIDDALVELEVAYMDNPNDLKKQLYVEFEGEQGIDEGGVSKEFFQLITEEIFNPDFGMFVYDADTRQFWFNPDSFENEAQFTLVGILLGLAIYNNIILDVRFPMVIYRKLMGKLGTIHDLRSSHPVLHSSLQQLLEYEGDVEEDFMTSFVLSRKNMFGEIISHSLKEGGAETFVTNDNRKEYCDMYVDYLLNQMVEKQFNAFYKGFHMVTDESPMESLFTPEEVEELVCGSDDWDLQAMENSTEYDGGFDSESETIKHFWEVVHNMSVEDQKRLLQFVSGSDRVPVGGLAKLKLVIAKNGPDSDRLPTSHTCFNVLLLPDYNNLEKLKERLLLAITHAKGFGML